MQLPEARRLAAEEALSILIGEPLTSIYRILGNQAFSFGGTRSERGKRYARGTIGLQTFCECRIEGPNGFSLSRQDFEPVRTDTHAAPFYARLRTDPLFVERVDVFDDGALVLGLTEGFSIVVTPNLEAGEQWRFMPGRTSNRGHLVLTDDDLSWKG
jgi:hypothetical protein